MEVIFWVIFVLFLLSMVDNKQWSKRTPQPPSMAKKQSPRSKRRASSPVLRAQRSARWWWE